MNAIEELVRFQTDRGLDKKPFDVLNENVNIVEELFEAHGRDISKEDRTKLKTDWNDFVKDTDYAQFNPTTLDDQADAYCDVIVFAVGALLKLGFDPEKALLETAKEINSREGEMIDGKFEKHLTQEAQAKWYKANYDLATL